MDTPLRWHQRLENYNKALKRLEECRVALDKDPENQLIRIALIGTFMFSFELGWKTLKDYLEYSGISVSLPRDVIKQAFFHGLVEDGQLWIDMLADRNLMVHVYDETKALQAGRAITDRYTQALVQVRDDLRKDPLPHSPSGNHTK